MINSQEWLQTRRNLLEQVKAQVQMRLGAQSQVLRRYAKNLELEFRGAWRPVTMRDLQRGFEKAKVVLSADFHAYSQSQKAHVRLLRDQVGGRPVILVLECLSVDHAKVACRFVSGKISETQFLNAVDWQKNWGFPWESYRPLFELARDRGLKIEGLSQARAAHRSLLQRDQWMAKRILRLSKDNPESLIFVVLGELHLASAHLPKTLLKSLGSAEDLMVVHQDAEQLYFKLASKSKESSVEILKSAPSRYCLMVSPPWMKWQSYLMYLEQAYDRDLQEDLAIDYSDHIVSLVELLESDLRTQVKKSAIQVYCPNSTTSLTRLRLSLPPRQQKALLYHLSHDQSFLVPSQGWMYLSRPTINHASALAGQFVHAQLSRRQRVMWDMPEDFLALVWIEAVGFLFSKWINPKRKADTLGSIRMSLAAKNPQEKGREALLLALDHRLSEVLMLQTGRLRRTRFKAKDVTAYFDAARIVGSMLGERLFQKVRSGTIGLPQLMSYLKVNVEQKNFAKFYWQVAMEVEHEQAL